MLGLLGSIGAIGVIAAAPVCGPPESTETSFPSQSVPERPAYQKLRSDEDYSFLKDPSARSDLWDPIKYIPLNESGDDYLSLGGEARWRYELYRNYRWNAASPDRDGFLLQRYLLHADLHLGDTVRVFGQIQTSLENWRAGGPRPTDVDRSDVHQLFADVRLWSEGTDDVTLRVGRQEMLYGSQRLVSVRESPNIRRSFEAVRLLGHVEGWTLDGFLARPVEDDPGSFDDWGDGRTTLWGVYATHALQGIDGASIDLYYLGLRHSDALYVQGAGDEVRHSIGARLFGTHRGWDYNGEGVVQLGTFGPDRIFAWTLATETGYTFRDATFKPRVGVRADVISGDADPADGRLGTFNPLFPRGAYFGESSIVGPANLIDLHPMAELHLSERVKVTGEWDIFWRFSTHDGLYDNGGNVLRRPGGSDATYVGNQPGVGMEWELGRHASLNASYSHFFAGDFVRQSGPGRDIDFLAVWLVYRF